MEGDVSEEHPLRDADIDDMRRIQAGQLECFASIVRRHQSRLFKYAVSRLRSRALAEDAVQETFLSVYRGRATFDPSRSFSTWLWSIHVRECRRTATRENGTRDAQWASDSVPRDGSAAGVDPLLQCVQQEARERLDQFLREIPADQADALRLRYFGELSFKETAETLGISEATAKSRVRYGLAKLAEKIPTEQESET